MEIVIFGMSDFINKVREDIPILVSKYKTIGINGFISINNNIDIWFFTDASTISKYGKFYNGQSICTQYGNKELLSFDNTCYYYPVIGEVILDDTDKLGLCHFTITSVLNWCIKNNIKSVYLVGIDMNYGKWDYVDNKNRNFNDSTIRNARKYLYNCLNYINIYKCNKESTLNIPYKDIKELIK